MRTVDWAMGLSIQPYQPELRDALFAFYGRCFAGRDPVAYEAVWRWQYFDNPRETCDSERIWVAVRDGEVVAHLGTMAAAVKLNGAVVRGRWSSDLMVDPRFRNGGLGVWLIREWIKACDVALAKGLSREVEQVYRRMGWERTPLYPIRHLPLTLRALTGRLVRNRLANAVAAGTTRWLSRLWTVGLHAGPADVEYETVSSLPAESDGLLKRVAARSTMAIMRDRAFLEWRYVRCPVRRYTVETAWQGDQLLGLAVLSVRNDRGFKRGIVHDLELDSPREDCLRGMLARCVRRLHDQGADEVAFLPRYELEQRVTASMGFVGRRPPGMMMCDVRGRTDGLAGLAVDCDVQLGDGDDW